MHGLADFARRLLAYALAVVAASTTAFVLLPVGPDFDGYGGDMGEIALRFGIVVYMVALAGTPFAMILLLVLRLSGAHGLAPAIAGGAASALLAALAFRLLLGGTDFPVLLAALVVVAGAVGGAVYHLAARGPKAAS